MKRKVACTIFQGVAGDHNDLAIPGAKALGEQLAQRSGATPVVIGFPAAATKADWREALTAALPDLQAMRARFEQIFSAGAISVAATSRCAVSLATLPALAKYHPDACVLWFDAHGDLNTPESSTSGFLGGLALSGPAGLWLSGLGSGLRLDQLVLVGQRDLDPFEENLIAQHNVPLIAPGPDVAERLRKAVAGRPVYLHLDCDVLEPGIVPTDYRSEGGLTLADLSACCDALAESPFSGIEIAEFQHAWRSGGAPVSPEPLLEALTPLWRRL
ncbi:arginase family protein [Pantoea sp. YU22]|uniref:arginase family protein n=1 Tax=Pantoea TaxID=53335 RepID=UPI000F8792C8|nr:MULTISPECIES: arginase family protein [Pantoea]RTY58190.1 arginase family protein [Pantoea sp. YU22]